MATPQQIEAAIKKVQDQTTFIKLLLKETLNWQIPEGIENIEDMSYIWPADDLRADGLDAKVVDGKVLQIQPFQQDQQWGIFLLEFKNADPFVKGRGLTGPLRKVLRGLVRKKRQQANRPAWDRENLLFICTHNYQHYCFAYFKAPSEKEKNAPLAMFGWNHRDSEIRTLCQHNLPVLEWDKQSEWAQAFSIEKVTKEFYRAYAAVFQAAEDYIAKANKDLKDDKMRLFTQMLFNRLMFLRFVEKKGWLKFGDGTDYLKNMFAAGGLKGKSFYKSRLCPLFFEGLAIENADCRDAVGDVPFLNGGLFEMTDLDKDVSDIPDEAFKGIIGDDGLFYHFNFTVEESTPIDIEVAVDPEMLGKVFEELVTARHETGSYYTPRHIVSFMCKEALKGYLSAKTSASKEAIALLVNDHEIARDLTTGHAEEILFYLETIKAVDPACGSGAYLLGLLQELIEIRKALQNQQLKADPDFIYKLKLRLISHCLYGVDIDPFATNIAKLRLWLSLSVEAETPQPLPNLDFKIETGDSILGPCDPLVDRDDALIMATLRERAEQLVIKKDRFILARGAEKARLFAEIKAEETAIAKETSTIVGEHVIAWHVHFAEVFMSARRKTILDEWEHKGVRINVLEPGGFDIVVTNPPYVRQELIGSLKPELRKRFPNVYTGTSDLYVYFYARALEMLQPDGVLSFIAPNKFFRSGYGKKLRSHFLTKSRLIDLLDFGDCPIFQAITYPSIIVAQKTSRVDNEWVIQTYNWAASDSLSDITRIVIQKGQKFPQADLSPEGWRILDKGVQAVLEKLRGCGTPLGSLLDNRFFRGIVTGCNEAFEVTQDLKDQLIASHPSSAEVIRPWVRGRNVRRWHVEFDEKYLIYSPWDLDIEAYPAVKAHLERFRDKLSARPECQEGRFNWWCMSRYGAEYAFEYNRPKIFYKVISTYQEMAYTNLHAVSNDKTWFVPDPPDGLLGLLNSKVCWFFLDQVAPKLQGGAFELRSPYMTQIPVPELSKDLRDRTRRIWSLVAQGEADSDRRSALEHEIDDIVVGLYNLTASEQKLIDDAIEAVGNRFPRSFKESSIYKGYIKDFFEEE